MRFLFLLVLVLGFNIAKANNYYFSTSKGSDGRTISQAQNPATPWRSIAKLNLLINSLKPGDSVLFMCNDIFEGSINITRSGQKDRPIVFGMYGKGKKPVISGFTTLSNWSGLGKGIFETSSGLFLSSVSTVLLDGKAQHIGRYPNADAPNKGYLKFESSTGKVQIKDNELSASPNWTNAEVVIRKNRWVIDRNLITSHSGNTINYASESKYSADPNFGYFIQNDPKTLDREGEWYFKTNGKKLGIYVGSGSPSSRIIRASVINTLVTIINQSNVVFSDLTFEGANESAFEISKCGQIRIFNCDILFSGRNAVNAINTNNITIESSVITYTNNNALNMGNCSNSIVKNNKIKCTGIFAGMGKGDSGSYEGLMLEGDNNLIERNEIDSTGYIPITFSGNSVIIKNNIINGFAFTKDDGGGIYTYNGFTVPKVNFGRKIIGNIILNGRGAGEGTNNTESSHANGIYMDDKVNNVEIVDNTVAYCGNYGIFIHNANSIIMGGNTLFDNKQQLGMSHDKVAPDNPIKNTKLFNNILFSKSPKSLVAEFKTIKNDLANFGKFDSNFYCRPVSENVIINSSSITNGVYTNKITSLEGWKSLSGNDKTSKNTPLQISSYKIDKLIGSTKFSNGAFNNDVSGLYIWSAAGNSALAFNKGTLDGGALKISFKKLTGTGNRSSLIIKVGSISAKKSYVLKFTSKATNDNKSLQVYLRQSVGGYKDLSERQHFILNGTRTENEIVFTPSISEENASLVFDVEEQEQAIYLDNILLFEADVSSIDPNNFILFEYNLTGATKAVSLKGRYIDVRKKPYSGTIQIKPFASVILMKSDGGTEETPPVPSQFPSCSSTGAILFERWDNIDGNSITDIPLEKAAGKANHITSLELNGLGDKYAARIRGYICPPETGNYIFYISGDDAGELYLSTNDDPTKKVKIASFLSWTNFRQWDKFTTQKSLAVNLTKGQRYYLEVLHKEGAGGDHVSVAWTLPSGETEAPISGRHLSPFSPSLPAKGDQTINFEKAGNKTFGDPDFNLSAVASSGLPVAFTVLSGPAKILGNSVKLTGAGTVMIEATQSGNDQFKAAAPVKQNIVVALPAPPAEICSATGNILLELWESIANNTVADIPVQMSPTRTSQLNILELNNLGDKYAARIRGYLCPPQTGNYVFFISGDDAGELWLSTNEDAANKVKIAGFLNYTNFRQWDKYSTQKSVQIKLIKGQRYYIEVLQKEGAGGDHVSVAWKLPEGMLEAPIPGSRISPFIPSSGVLKKVQTISFPTIATKIYGASSFDLNATASSGLPVSFIVSAGPATISGSKITLTGAGSVVVEARQSGNIYYDAAPAIKQTFKILQDETTLGCSATGSILLETWNNVEGNTVKSIPLSKTPLRTSQLSELETKNLGDNYGVRIRGYICAPQTGNYTFYISGDDAAELWLSNNDQPVNKVKIAGLLSWTNFRELKKFPSQKSVAITLTKGQRYYVEVLHKDGKGDDHVSVGWTLPDGKTELPITMKSLSPFIPSASTLKRAVNKDSHSEESPNQLIIYPNPIKKLGNIEFTSRETGEYQIGIFDLQGRVIQLLFKGNLVAGIKRVFAFNPGNVATGIYFVRVISKDGVLSEMVVIGK